MAAPIAIDHLPVPGGKWVCGCLFEAHADVREADRCRSDAVLRDLAEVSSINHPKHYNAHPSGVECIDVVETYSFNVGNAIKYLWRAGLKSKDPLEDLRKAEWYVRREIQRLEKSR